MGQSIKSLSFGMMDGLGLLGSRVCKLEVKERLRVRETKIVMHRSPTWLDEASWGVIVVKKMKCKKWTVRNPNCTVLEDEPETAVQKPERAESKIPSSREYQLILLKNCVERGQTIRYSEGSLNAWTRVRLVVWWNLKYDWSRFQREYEERQKFGFSGHALPIGLSGCSSWETGVLGWLVK